MNAQTQPAAVQSYIPWLFVVDDEPDMAALFAGIGRRAGFAVKAMNDQRALAATFEDCRPDAIVLDLFLGATDASAIFEWLQHRHFRGAVILVSGYDCHTLTDYLVRGRAAGLYVLGLIQKGRPSELERLGEILRTHCVGARALRSAPAGLQ